MKNVVFTGFMGTGKTTIAKLYAKKNNMEYIDLDAVIEEEAGDTIPNIFAKKGEPVFRDIETACIKKMLSKNKIVLSARLRYNECFWSQH